MSRSPAVLERMRQCTRRLYAARKARGLCRCGKNPIDPRSLSRCRRCLDAVNAKADSRYADVPDGRCHRIGCREPAEPGYKKCNACRLAFNEYQRRRKERLKRQNHSEE